MEVQRCLPLHNLRHLLPMKVFNLVRLQLRLPLRDRLLNARRHIISLVQSGYIQG